ncbi:MAG TPA: cytidine deaminase [Vicinamibacterales bacterium]|nr:cytidine deaminase [Vicinamibacterales bacterium]
MSGSDERHASKRPHGERRAGGDRRRRPARDHRAARDRRDGADRRSEAGWQPVALDGTTGTAPASADALVAAAAGARTHARCEFSGFAVGAALETTAHEVITGCNVENATYGLTMCAERVALYKALSEGRGPFLRVAVVADTAEPTPPCGACRQLLWEFCGDVEVILANLSGITARLRLSGLLPLPFDARLLK